MKSRSFLLAACAAAVLAACGGGGSVDSSAAAATTLKGTAAGGAPINGTLFVKDSKGVEKPFPINLDGSYNVDVSGMTGPFMLKAVGTVGGTSVTYYSAATAADLGGTVNVTPFTSLIISNIAGQIADNYYSSGQFGSTLSATALTQAQTNLQQKLAPMLTALGLDASTDLLKASFTANHSGLDAALDLVKVSIDPNTNVATLTNALTGTTIGQDDLASKSDNTPVVILDPAALATAKTDMQQMNDLLGKFATLFATSLPSVTQLANSGIFDTSPAFMMGGSSFTQFANSVTLNGSLLGIKFSNSAIVFDAGNPNAATVKVTATNKDGKTENIELRIGRADASSPWKVVGDGKIADINVSSSAVYRITNSGGSISTNGLQISVDPTDYNTNHPSAMITAATITGPGLPAGGVNYTAAMAVPYLMLAQGGNVIPECTAGGSTACVSIANTVDNGEYTIQLKAGTMPISGASYKMIVAKKPLATSELSASMFPAITSMTIDGVNLTSTSQLQSNKVIAVSWTMPSTLLANNLSLYSSSVSVDLDLLRTDTSKTLALGVMPNAAMYAGVWLSARDAYGRRFSLDRPIGQ